jgi:hypothetical protein
MADKIKKKTTAGKKPVEKRRSKHDEAVKDFLSENETAKSFFQEYLPPEEQGRAVYWLSIFEIHGPDLGIVSQTK